MRLRLRSAVLSAAFTFTALLLAAAGLAGGGRTIAAAPTIALGEEQVNSVSGIDFWRISVRDNDRMTLRFGPDSGWAELCLLTPDVTDTTVGNQRCYATKNAYSDTSMTLDVRPGGLWTIAMLPYSANCESGGILNLRCTSGVSYHLTAYVKHRTRMSLQAPTIARHGAKFYARGTLTGVHATVVLQQSWNGGGWRAVSLVKPSPTTGTFRVQVKAARTGILRLRAMLPEAPTYLGATAIASVRVV
jgi:hypothetical protein